MLLYLGLPLVFFEYTISVLFDVNSQQDEFRLEKNAHLFYWNVCVCVVVFPTHWY